MNWNEFLSMGGYAFYVWGSYSFAAVVLALNVVWPIFKRRQIVQMLRELSRIKPEGPE